MAIEATVTAAHALFAGEDRVLSFEVLAPGSDPANAHAVMSDVAAFTFAWSLARMAGLTPYTLRGPVLITKTSSGGDITVTGVFNADRALNTQRVLVSLADTDTEALPGVTYVHALKRMDSGAEAVLSYGTFRLLVSPVA